MVALPLLKPVDVLTNAAPCRQRAADDLLAISALVSRMTFRRPGPKPG
jgi:hypothetical protein